MTPTRSILAAGAAALLLSLAAGTCLSGCDARAGTADGGQGLLIEAPLDPQRPYYHDFGTVELGDQLSHVFELRNTDPEPVVVTRISPACVCTLGRVWCVDADGNRTEGAFLSEPVIEVPPGGRLFIDIQLDTNHVAAKNTDKLAIVRLTCDSKNKTVVTFELHTIVQAPLQITPRELDLKDVPQSAGGQGTVQIVTAMGGSPVRVLGVGECSPELEVEVADLPNFDFPSWSATARLEPGLRIGPYNGWFDLRVTDYDGQGEGRPVRVAFHAMVTPDVVVSPSPLSFSNFTPEEGATARALVRALVPGERILVENASVSGEHADDLRVELAPTDPDGTGRSPTWAVSIVAPPELEGESFQGTLRLELDHGELPELKAQYVCRPR